MKRKARNPSILSELMQGLNESLAHARGELTLRTTTLPAPPPKVKPRQIAALRKRLRMSQAVFAGLLNVSTKTVQSWEQGARVPRAGDLRLLQVLASDPQRVQEVVGLTGRAGDQRARSERAA